MSTIRRRLTRSGFLTFFAAVAVIGMCLWVVNDLGGFELMSTIDINGQQQRVVSTLATVDHPFHATRADTLLKSLQHGQPLRWIANHQGGYPAEFYPLGIAWFDVGLWAALAGQFPIIAVHKLAVLLIFVLPVAGFWILARGDRLNPFVPFLALAIHISVPGDWMHGGEIELVYWGLVANVGGSTLAFISLAALSRFVIEGTRWFGVLAVLTSSAAIYANTRSSIAMAVAAMAVLISTSIRSTDGNVPGVSIRLARIALVGVLSALIAAPLLFPLIRYQHLYYFVNFESYESIGEYISASATAVTPIVLAAAILGTLVTLISRAMPHARSASVALILFMAATISLSSLDRLANLIQQLETPRLMPFQRFLAIYVAAAIAGWTIERVATAARRQSAILASGGIATVAILVILLFQGTFGPLPSKYQHPVMWTTGYPELTEFTNAVDIAASLLPEGTAIYVVGDRQNWWHEALWAPTQTDAPFFYDDFMWFWHGDHQGPYDNDAGHAYHDPIQTFNPEWLRAHGIGVMVVTNMQDVTVSVDPREAVRSNPNFTYQSTSGFWDIYLVNNPVSIMSNGDIEPTSVVIKNDRMTGTFSSASGEVQIRRNWFPRWQAYADGHRVDIQRTANGYISITVPPGTQEVELRYAVTRLDWLARVSAAIGLVLTGCLAWKRPGASRLPTSSVPPN